MTILVPYWRAFLQGLAAGIVIGYFWWRWSSGQMDGEEMAFRAGYLEGFHDYPNKKVS